MEQPRVEVSPPAVDSLGEVAASLGERAGVALEPWQRAGLDVLLGIRDDGRWSCYEYAELCSRRNGKTALLLVRALFGFLLLGETPILWTAQELKTSMRAWKDFRAMLRKLGRWDEVRKTVDLGDGVRVKVVASNGRHGFERLDTGAELLMVARSKDSGRGFDADFLVLDEAYDFTAEQQDALAPTQMARPNAQIAYASSPPLSGAASEALYRLRRRAEGSTPGRLGWRDWGRGECLDDVLAMPDLERMDFLDDPAVWASANPALGHGRVTEETIRNMRESMTDGGFGREVVGLWPRQVSDGAGWAVISEGSWRARGAAPGRPDRDVTFCLDASWPSAAMGAIGVAGQLHSELVVQVVDHRPGTGWMVDRAKELRERWPRAKWVLDKAGPAGHLIGELTDSKFELELPTAGDLARAHGLLVAAVVGDRPWLRHFDQADLDAAVRAAGTRTLGDGQTWARQGDADISPLTAVTGAAWLAARRPVAPPPAPVAVAAASMTGDLMTVGF